ncbi:DUF748 domain-containing protein [Microbulbifer aggregans]|uniref:DUF748 domain-containing protein n=1 Tax=Microbulbifer aggregans TaxID=1769779 RepID=UPI001CFDB713|nr:DUF748 domain-containing protein [Microbulbifer aggregans]
MSVATASAAQIKGLRRLLWLLVFLLLLIGALNLFVASWLPGAIQRWLHERGLEAAVEHIDLSLPRLRADLRGVEVRNQYGRGFRAQEATLGLSWWSLLRGKVGVKLVELEDVHFDLESEPGKRGRVWEIGGWRMEEGPKKDKNWRVELAAAKVRRGVVCYQHKPLWPSASCARIDELELQDFFVAAKRTGDEPLQFSIGADDLTLQNLLAWDEKTPADSAATGPGIGEGNMARGRAEDPTLALVLLKLEDGLFERPGNRFTADDGFVRKFAGCPPQRWADAVPGLTRLIGHCGSARRLEVKGPMNFAFGRNAEVAWRRVSGQEVRLRFANRALPNWHAETIALNSFDYLRAEKKLTWRSGGSSGFSWCPSRWRNREQHYCIRAGSLRLPQPTAFTWADGFRFATREAVLSQGSLLDRAAPKVAENPVTANQLRIADLAYGGRERLLELQRLSLDGVAGCIPGQLWQSPDQCVQLSQLQVPDSLALRFPQKTKPGAWGLDSGPLHLTRLQLLPRRTSGKTPRKKTFDLQKLHWARAAIGPAEAAQQLQDFSLLRVDGCVPGRWLPKVENQNVKAPRVKDSNRDGDLCARVNNLKGDGNFAVQTGSDPHVILGELRVDNLLLADQLTADPKQQQGLLLRELLVGNGLFRTHHSEGDGNEPLSLSDFGAWFSDGMADDEDSGEETAEKGLLSEPLSQDIAGTQGIGVEDIVSAGTATSITEGELQSLSLLLVDGCLPGSWGRLIYRDRDRSRTPECFSVANLRQQQPLNIVMAMNDHPSRAEIKRHFHFDAAELSLERARVSTASGDELLGVEGLAVPSAELTFASSPVQAKVRLPEFALKRAHFCLVPERCVTAATLQTGERFELDYNRERFSTDFNNLMVEQFDLTGGAKDYTAHVNKLESLQLKLQLPRLQGARADWQMLNLQAAELEVCWPQSENPGALPRCAIAENLRSRGHGLDVARIALQSATGSAKQLEIVELGVDRVGMAQQELGPVQLNLQGLSMAALDGCLPGAWLPRSAADKNVRQWGTCLAGGDIRLSGDNLIAFGRGTHTPDRDQGIPIVDLGPAQVKGLALRTRTGKETQASLEHLSWQALRWRGGRTLDVTDLNANSFSGCLPATAAQAGSGGRLCAQLARLGLPGRQQLQLGPVVQTSGRLEVEGLVGTQDGRKRFAVGSLGVESLAVGRNRFTVEAGEVKHISGCLSGFRLGKKMVSPCVEFERVTMDNQRQLDLAPLLSGERQLRNIRIEGLRVSDTAVQGQPVELLKVAQLHAELFAAGGRQLQVQNLQLQNVHGCLPEGYFSRINHCLKLAVAETSGSYRFDERVLALAQVQLFELFVDNIEGSGFLEVSQSYLSQFQVMKNRVSFASLDMSYGKLLRRRENAQEFSKRQWNSEFERLQLNQFQFDTAAKQLEIDTIELVRPRSIVARGRSGDYGAWEFLRDDEPNARPRYRRGDLSREANRFHYRIREAVVDEGHFLWLDDYHEQSAHLPLQHINILLRNVSSHASDPPALVLLNARPGNIGDVQLAGTIDLKSDSRWDACLLGYVVAANLIPATPYMAKLLGYKILQGQLDATLDLGVKSNDVNAEANMILNKIKVRRVRDTDQLNVERSIIPLSLALALLKDGDGDVKFKMPVTGDLFDPDFNFSYIFSDLLQRAILEALFAYFTPVGFYSLAKLAWARFRSVEFEPILFRPGSNELDTQARAELTANVALMRDNPKARPGICGVATVRDMRVRFPEELARHGGSRDASREFLRNPPKEIRDELIDLALQRGREVQKYLIEAGLDAQDFIQCAPDYIGTDFDEPRVEISN